MLARTEDRPAWYPDWTGLPCVIVAAGSSAKGIDLDRLRGRVKVLAVNRSFELVPWADALYACDFKFWLHYQDALAFAGLKITQDVRAIDRWPQLQRIASGGNGGFQAVSLAAQWGANPIYLAGFDMRGSHWHPDHPKPLNNPQPHNFANWIEKFNEAAPLLKAAGVKVFNLNPRSALRCFEFASLESIP